MEELRKLLFGAFQTFWTAAATPFPVEYENQPGTRPDTGPYGRLTIIPGEENPASIGPNHTRHMGQLVLQIFIREEAGMKVATDAAEALRDYFTFLTLTAAGPPRIDVDCETVSFRPAGARDGYKQYNAWVKYRCDTLFPG